MLTDDEIAKLCLDDAGRRLILKEHPPVASMSPQNTVYFPCEVYQGRPSYAACLNFLDVHAKGRDVLRPECQQAVARNTCPATNMRAREAKAGRALYYVRHADLQALRAEMDVARDDHVVTFRKTGEQNANKGRKFVPSTPEDLAAYAAGNPSPKYREPRKPFIPIKLIPEVAPKKDADIELETNIFKKVLEKRLADEQSG